MTLNKQAIVNRVMDGGYFILVMFGFTICLLSTLTLLCLLFMKNPNEKVLEIAQRLLDSSLGFMTGAFMTMWNNLHYRKDVKDGTVQTSQTTTTTQVKPKDQSEPATV